MRKKGSIIGKGVRIMMGFGYSNMMQGFSWFSGVAFLLWIVILIDLILLGIFLWKQINKK